ncbi:MAG: ParM/StbA family protein [Deltaproteobacteria bacterium]|nr:ParM/StbA family protein [Deltaproteobacteria bacterium]
MKAHGIDIGFGFTKATNGKDMVIFKSVLGEPVDIQFVLNPAVNDGLRSLHIVLDGQSYFVGDFAEQQSNARQFTLDQESLISQFAKALALTAVGQLNSSYDIINVVSGLPVGFFRQYHQRLSKTLAGSHEITFKTAGGISESRKFSIQRIKIIPQPLGTLLNLIMNDMGAIVNERLTKQKVGIVDIGFRTTDFCLFDALRYVERGSSTTDTGMSRCFGVLSKKLREETGVDVELYRMYDAVEKGFIRIRGKEVNISKAKERLFENAARTIAGDMNRLWADDWDMDAIVVTGGGATALTKYLQPLVTGNIIPSDPASDQRLNNVKGYVKYARHLWGSAEAETPNPAPASSYGEG